MLIIFKCSLKQVWPDTFMELKLILFLELLPAMKDLPENSYGTLKVQPDMRSEMLLLGRPGILVHFEDLEENL